MQIRHIQTAPALLYLLACAVVALLALPSALALQPAAEVERLQGELDELRLRYTDRHPDVVQLLRQIERLQAERSEIVKKADASATAAFGWHTAQEIERLKGNLDMLRLRYTDTHPDVVQLLSEIERLEAEYSAIAQEPEGRETKAPPRTYFKFQKTGTLVKRPEGMPKPGPYWPTLVSMEAVEDFPFDYALYFSTDHHSGGGGIWLYVCNGIPSDPACWRSYDDVAAAGAFDHIAKKPAKNPIFSDTVQGNQTETPHANVIDGVVYMTYHNNRAGHNQSTLLATSPDGVNFTRINGDADSVILDYDPKTAPGDGHTGYFRWGTNPFARVPYRYMGYSLHGGGPRPHNAMWGSNDARRWVRLGITSGSRHTAPAQVHRTFWHIDPNSIRRVDKDRYVAITAGGVPHHGRSKKPARIYEIDLSPEGLELVGMPRVLVPSGEAQHDDALMAFQPTLITIDRNSYLIYTGVSRGGLENALMSAIGTWKEP